MTDVQPETPLAEIAGLRAHITALEAELATRSAELDLLYRAGRELGRTLDLATLYRTLRTLIAEQMACDALVISSYRIGEPIICRYSWQEGVEIPVDAFPPIPLEEAGHGTQSIAIRTGESLLLPDFQAYRRTAATSYLVDNHGNMLEPEPESEGIDIPRSALIVPLKMEDAVHGVLQVFSFRLDAYTALDLQLLESLATQLAYAEANAKLYAQATAELAARQVAEEAMRGLYETLEQRVRERTQVLESEVAERRQAEAILHQREDQLRLLADNTTDIIMRFTLDGIPLYVTPSVKAVLGYDVDELMCSQYGLMTHPDDMAHVRESLQELAQTGGPVRSEARLLHKQGYYVWLETVSKQIRDVATGEPIGVVCSSRDISERKAVQAAFVQRSEELSMANVELARASCLKDEFLANMSHELRTPLTGILGLAEGLQNIVYGPLNERQLRALRLIEESGRHLLNLINDILDLSKVEAGKLDVLIEYVLAADVCRSSLRMVKQIAEKKHQQVALVLEPSALIVQADARRLKQILVNLLSNAVKFTPEHGELGLQVAADVATHSVHFTVWDKGIGIAQEQQAKIFQPFIQLDSGLARQFSGTGLGLALVRRLTELHGGSVAVFSTPGDGSRFVVTLPWTPDMPASSATVSTSAPPVATAPDRHAGHVLLVEDNVTTAIAMVDYLSAYGFHVSVVYTGVEAVARVAALRPDVILMDVQMPEMDGIEATRRIRALPDRVVADTPIIAVTALAMVGDRERCVAAGANDYVSKPFELTALSGMIQRYLHHR